MRMVLTIVRTMAHLWKVMEPIGKLIVIFDVKMICVTCDKSNVTNLKGTKQYHRTA